MSVIEPTTSPTTNGVRLSRVAVGSTNPVKIAAVAAVLARCGWTASVVGVAVASGVRDQPFGDAETIRGATQRARAALTAGDADFEGFVEAPRLALRFVEPRVLDEQR